jgi:uncharacterized membrane protein
VFGVEVVFFAVVAFPVFLFWCVLSVFWSKRKERKKQKKKSQRRNDHNNHQQQ